MKASKEEKLFTAGGAFLVIFIWWAVVRSAGSFTDFLYLSPIGLLFSFALLRYDFYVRKLVTKLRKN